MLPGLARALAVPATAGRERASAGCTLSLDNRSCCLGRSCAQVAGFFCRSNHRPRSSPSMRTPGAMSGRLPSVSSTARSAASPTCPNSLPSPPATPAAAPPPLAPAPGSAPKPSPLPPTGTGTCRVAAQAIAAGSARLRPLFAEVARQRLCLAFTVLLAKTGYLHLSGRGTLLRLRPDRRFRRHRHRPPRGRRRRGRHGCRAPVAGKDRAHSRRRPDPPPGGAHLAVALSAAGHGSGAWAFTAGAPPAPPRRSCRRLPRSVRLPSPGRVGAR